MEKLLNLNIHTPYKTIFQGQVSTVVASGEIGYFGILPSHAPFISILIPGDITFKEEGGKFSKVNSKSMGFLEVLNNKVTVLLDSAEI